MQIHWWQMFGILFLAGCGSQNSQGDYVEAVPENADQGLAPQPVGQQTAGEEPSNKAPEKPTIDLELVSIDLPGTIKREAEFPITVTMRNNSNAKLSFAEYKVRAGIKSPTSVMDLALAGGTARDIGPNESKTVTFTSRAPHVVAAPAEITVSVSPGLATDPKPENNRQRRNAYVVN